MSSKHKFEDFTLEELLDRLHLDYTDNGKMDCPFCGRRRKVNLDFEENWWRCPACDAKGGVLHLFVMMKLGMDELPSDEDQRKKIPKLMREFMEGAGYSSQSQGKPKKPERPKIPVAMDDDLNAVYSAMQKIPALQLLPEHKADLLRRGLTEDLIRKNGYLSIPEIMPTPELYAQMYKEEGGEERRRHTFGQLSAQQIILGLLVAHSVESQGLSLQGIPGFFKFGKRWCYWCPPGMLIPTRNIQGQIVIYQVRQKDADRKYQTVSWKSLPGHVNVPVSRCHFPLGNAPLSSETPVLVTEGPLKADIACFLWGKPVVFAAIQGVTNTSDLLKYSEVFKSAGISKVNNAFDMDRLTNPNVRNGSLKLAQKYRERGIAFRDLYWGSKYATDKCISLSVLAKHHNVSVKIHPNASVFDQLNELALALGETSLKAFVFKDANGNMVKEFWDPETKGIDDYLFHRK